MTAKLALSDIADQRAYERERDSFRARIIELKKLRRVAVGPIVTFVFENRDTIRFQIQEMARVEKLLTDDAILNELDTYNPLIPEPGELSTTMFIEMVTDEEQRHWKPLLVGILDCLFLRIGEGDEAITIKADIEEAHAELLTREIPPSVNYVRFAVDRSGSGSEISEFRRGPVNLVIDHPNYQHATPLSEATIETLMQDLRP